MKRSVIQIANSTQMISLPRSWSKRFNIQKGDELEVMEKGTMVTISTENAKSSKKREIDFAELEPTTIKKVLYGLYNVGYDEVKINFPDVSSLDFIQEVLKDEMIGYEIIEQKEHHIIVKSIAGGIETEFDNMLRRALVLLNTMSEGVLNALKKKDAYAIKSLKYLEVNNNKYIAFCYRILSRRGYVEFEKTHFMYGVLGELEKCADQLKYLCDYLEENKHHLGSIDQQTLEFFESVNKYVEEANILFYNFDLKKVNKFFIKRKALIKRGLDITNKHNLCSVKVKNKGICHTRMTFYAVNLVQNLVDMIARRMESLL
ncbi:MAG: hypothetical protein V1740_05080 [Candidatus Woesearchaeota archaeon]